MQRECVTYLTRWILSALVGENGQVLLRFCEHRIQALPPNEKQLLRMIALPLQAFTGDLSIRGGPGHQDPDGLLANR